MNMVGLIAFFFALPGFAFLSESPLALILEYNLLAEYESVSTKNSGA